MEESLKSQALVKMLDEMSKEHTPVEDYIHNMEYRGGEIIQLRGKHNQDPPKEVEVAANHWLAEINRKRGQNERNRTDQCLAV